MQYGPVDERLAVVERMIKGRMELINRLFDDVRELTEERDRISGRRSGLVARFFEARSGGR